jgi:plasmid stability protein
MPLLQVRDIPEDLYEKLSRVAEADNRSIAQETIVLLKKALGYKEERIARRKRIFAEIKANKIANADKFPDPAELIREDRER